MKKHMNIRINSEDNEPLRAEASPLVGGGGSTVGGS